MDRNLQFKAAAEATLTIAADPRHLGASIGITAVLHTWGSAMTHHPHVHMIVPGGGISADGSRWVVLPARARAVSLVPPPLPEDDHGGARSRPPRILRRPRRARRQKSICHLHRPPAQGRVPSRWGCCRPHPSQTRTRRFPASGSSRERFTRDSVVAMDDPRRRKRMSLQESVEAVPGEHALTIPTGQPFLPDPHDFMGVPP